MSDPFDPIEFYDEPISMEPPTIGEEITEAVEDMVDQLIASHLINGDINQIKQEDNLSGLAKEYVTIDNAYNILKVPLEKLNKLRGNLRQILNEHMVRIGTNKALCPDGTAVTISDSVRAGTSSIDEFIEWCHRSGKLDLLETKARLGSEKNPGLNQLVKDEVERAKLAGEEPRLPDGVYYFSQLSARITKPSKTKAFNDAANTMLDELTKWRQE